MIKRLDTDNSDFDNGLHTLLLATAEPDQDIVATVDSIVRDVRERGDDALLEYTNRFDRRQANITDIEISSEDLQQALSSAPKSLRHSLERAAERIRNFHERQKQTTWTYQDSEGNTLGQKVTPLDRVGVYVPGGKATYPSSVLMNIIPAHVAGVEEIIMVVPTPDDKRHNLVLAAAAIAGVTRVFSIGGAQAIAALAYGTETIPGVDKIVGPGNIYVATAKQQVFGAVGIDMIAGPSEVVIVSDGNANPDWAAMDMFAQAEHDEKARAILISPDAGFINRVAASVDKLLPEMERAKIIKASLSKNGAFIKVKDLEEAANIVNIIAPEHLELLMGDAETLLPSIRHAGAIFIGHFAAESLGDYCAGPNHVLPTSRTARFSSPLGVYDFQKQSSLIMSSSTSVAGIADIAVTIAYAEGLTAHARSAEYRRDAE